ncbi:MAG: single-stranded DNA-binding protein [Candidatus Dojkabacteria bacterium]
MSLFGDLNQVKLLGNMTQDVELRYTSNSTPVANFSIATNRRFKQNDQWQDATDFHNIVVFGNLADQLGKRAKKGTRILVEGRLQTRSWEGNDGKKNYRTEVIADDVYLIDRYEKGKSDELPENNYVSEGGSAAASNNAPAGSSAPQTKSGGEEDIDPDDLPF